MIKLKDLLKESHVWERKFGEKLPTLTSIQKKKLNEVGVAQEHKKFIKNIQKAEENMHKHIALYKGYLDNGDSLVLTYPTSNNAVKNFIGIGIADCDYRADTNVQVYELDYNQPMTDDFVLNLLTQSHGWDIKEYGDLSGY